MIFLPWYSSRSNAISHFLWQIHSFISTRIEKSLTRLYYKPDRPPNAPIIDVLNYTENWNELWSSTHCVVLWILKAAGGTNCMEQSRCHDIFISCNFNKFEDCKIFNILKHSAMCLNYHRTMFLLLKRFEVFDKVFEGSTSLIMINDLRHLSPHVIEHLKHSSDHFISRKCLFLPCWRRIQIADTKMSLTFLESHRFVYTHSCDNWYIEIVYSLASCEK